MNQRLKNKMLTQKTDAEHNLYDSYLYLPPFFYKTNMQKHQKPFYR